MHVFRIVSGHLFAFGEPGKQMFVELAHETKASALVQKVKLLPRQLRIDDSFV